MRDRFTQNQVLKEYSVWKDIGLYAVLVVMFLLAFFGSLTYGKARR